MTSQDATGRAVFDTPIGWCGLAWGEHGVTAVRLPDGSQARTRNGLAARAPGLDEREPPPEVRRVIDGIITLLHGEPVDLSDVEVDMSGVPDFHRRVYEVTRTIPPGATMTYGEIAHALGDPKIARDVGQALGHNPFPIVVPCHRVTAAGGALGGFSATGGVVTKRRMLAIEGAGPLTLFDL